MLIHKAYKTRVYPTKKQEKQLINHFGSARFIYNYFLQYKTDQYKTTKKSAPLLVMSRELTLLKQKQEYNWLNNISRQCLLNSIKNLDTAFNSFFQKKTKYPNFKKRHKKQTFKISAPFCSIKENGVHIPLIGILNCDTNSLPEKYKFLSVTVSKTVTNKYFIAINIETEITDPKTDKNKPIIGLDFGLKTFITTSNGEKINQPKFANDKKKRRLSRILSRRTKGSKRRQRARLRLAVYHEKTHNRRNDYLHKLSSKMVSENQAIILEDLSIKGMMNRFGKQLGELGWHEYTRQLSYKGKWYGCIVEKTDRFFPSSKICSECGFINDNLKLSDREWVCPSCSVHHDRDNNAAKNILEYGRADRNLRTWRGRAISSLTEASKH